jgi:retron-type reverse transcriptase
VKKKEELPMNLDRGAWQIPLDFAREEQWALHANLFRPEPTAPAFNDQPALDVSPEDALMEQIVSPNNLRRAWRQVKGNRGAPGPDGMKIAELEAWARENWAMVRQQLLEGTYQPQPVRRKTIPKPGGKGDRMLAGTD